MGYVLTVYLVSGEKMRFQEQKHKLDDLVSGIQAELEQGKVVEVQGQDTYDAFPVSQISHISIRKQR